MYNKVLVPCDGSELAQRSVFPHVVELAKNHEAEVIILRVIPGPPGKSGTAYRARTPGMPLSLPEAEEDARVARHPIYRDQEIASAVDEAKRSVAGAAAILRNDLIVMCSHGSGGIRRWVFGSVTEKVVSSTSVPLLIIRPEELTNQTAREE
jgi:nucleotide-binding universal stress UspA family protein